MFHLNLLKGLTTTGHKFQLHEDDGGYMEEGGQESFNPPTFLEAVDLQFEFKGFVDNTRITIHVIRQKKLAATFYNQSDTDNYLPETLPNLTKIAGFSPYEIDRKTFQVIAERKIFMNSKGAANVADTAQDRNTSDPTTTSVKYAHIRVPFKKELKPINPDTYDESGISSFVSTKPFMYRKMHPLANVWCLISCDDVTDFGSTITGDAVSVNIIRKVMWRDPLP